MLGFPEIAGDATASPRGPEGSADIPEPPAAVETGPGQGALPLPLLAARARVLVVEADTRLAAAFGERGAVLAGDPGMTATGAGAARLFPTRFRGRNPLHDREVAARFAAAAPGPAVCGGRGFSSAPEGPAGIEIGPAKGALPLPLFAAGARGLAVGADIRLAAVIGERGAVPAGGRG